MEAKLERAKADLKLLKRAVREREERATQAEAALKEGEATLAAAREELAQAASDRKLLRRHARQLEEALAAARAAPASSIRRDATERVAAAEKSALTRMRAHRRGAGGDDRARRGHALKTAPTPSAPRRRRAAPRSRASSSSSPPLVAAVARRSRL